MTKSRFPSDLSKQEKIERMIRVNHAGEYGAKRIYAGQLAVLKGKKSAEIIRHMAKQEEEHLQEFSTMINGRKVRPTAMLPLWHLAGYALGTATALMGEKAAMACTVAVEEVIDKHYAEQMEELKNDRGEKELYKKVKKFRDDELEHRDIALNHDAEAAPAYQLLSKGIKAISKTAIWISKRV